MKTIICNSEPSTPSVRANVYHMNLPLFVLDAIRLYQSHPKFVGGLKECHLVTMFETHPYACGDVKSQIKMAIRVLQEIGFVRYIDNGYRTLGPFAKLALARTARQLNIAWNKINQNHSTTSTTSLSSSYSS